MISSLIPFANRWILRPFLNLPRHRLVDECLLGVIRLATGSAAPAAAEYESALLDLKQPVAVEQSSRSTAQGDRSRDTGFHVVGREAVALAN